MTTTSLVFQNAPEWAALEYSYTHSINLKTHTSERALVYSSSTRNLCKLSLAEFGFLITLLKQKLCFGIKTTILF